MRMNTGGAIPSQHAPDPARSDREAIDIDQHEQSDCVARGYGSHYVGAVSDLLPPSFIHRLARDARAASVMGDAPWEVNTICIVFHSPVLLP